MVTLTRIIVRSSGKHSNTWCRSDTQFVRKRCGVELSAEPSVVSFLQRTVNSGISSLLTCTYSLLSELCRTGTVHRVVKMEQHSTASANDTRSRKKRRKKKQRKKRSGNILFYTDLIIPASVLLLILHCCPTQSKCSAIVHNFDVIFRNKDSI